MKNSFRNYLLRFIAALAVLALLVAVLPAGTLYADDKVIHFGDPDARVQDDFYAFVNGKRLSDVEIPDGRGSYSLSDIGVDSYLTSQTELVKKAIAQIDSYEKHSPEYNVAVFAEQCFDLETRNRLGIKPLKKWIKKIRRAKNVEELRRASNEYAKESGETFFYAFNFATAADDPTEYMVYVSIDPFSPEKEVILDDSMSEFNDAFKDYVRALFEACGFSGKKAKKKADRYFEFLKEFNEHTLSAENAMDPNYNFVPFTESEFEEAFPNLKLSEELHALGISEAEGFKRFDAYSGSELFTYWNDFMIDENLKAIKNAAIVKVLDCYAYFLSEDIYRAKREYCRVRNGAAVDFSFEDVTSRYLAEKIPESFGTLYAEEYCSEQIKQDVTDMAEQVVEAYKKMISNSEWLEASTKAKAIEKLEAINLMIAYPEEDETYGFEKSLKLTSTADGGTLVGNVFAISKAQLDAAYRMTGGEINSKVWPTYPQAYNAYYFNYSNSVILPAAYIVFSGEYSPESSYAENLGSLGSSIAHEISHAFDNNGSQYDKDGAISSWWTDHDRAEYKKRAQKVIKAYNNFEVYEGKFLNGKLAISENLADLGSAKCLETICNGDAAMFREVALAFAKKWGEVSYKDYVDSIIAYDVHSPAYARVNIPISQCALFYEAFDVHEGDGMYVAPEKRIGIW